MKKFFLFMMMAAVLSAAGFAQSLPTTGGGGFTSPQSSATQGRIRSDADNFIRPDAYSGVKFENWYGLVSFAKTGQATLGYATKASDSVILGVLYNGTFWANLPALTSTEITTTWLGTPNKSGVTYFATLPALQGTNPLNQIAVLVGLADMGFRFSFTSTYNNISQNDFIAGTTQYKYLEIGNGWLAPQLAWSMTKNLAENGIRPWATLELAFYNDFSKSQQYTIANVAADEAVARSMNYTQPELNIGLGGITIQNKNSWRTSFDAEYRLRLRMYDNEYVNTDGKISSLKGTNNGGTLSELEYNYHRILPSFSTQWNGEKLRLRAKLDLPFEITNAVTTPKAISGGALVTTGNTANALTLGFTPSLALAAQWQIASNFFLNAGGQVTFSAFSIATTEGELFSSGTKVDNSAYKNTNTQFGTNVTNNLTLGVTLNATDNLSFEAASGVSNSGSNSINVFGTADGLLVFTSILATLRF